MLPWALWFVLRPQKIASQKATHIPLWHSPFLATAPSVRNFKVGLGLEETWCLFKDHFAVVFISSLPKVLSYHFLPHSHLDFLTNPNISSICHFWSATSLAVATSLWYLGQSWKTVKKERTISCCSPYIGHSFQDFSTGVAIVTCLGGDLELPCANHSHFQPSLTSMCHSRWEGLSQGYRKKIPMSRSLHRGSPNVWAASSWVALKTNPSLQNQTVASNQGWNSK